MTESLNALYVCGAKLSFLTRLAATTEGAERLIELQLVSRLTQSAFLASPPLDERMDLGRLRSCLARTFVEHFAEYDSYLPPVSARYNELLLSVLELLNSLAIHSSQHRTIAAQQLLSFALAHKDTFANIMQQASSGPTLTTLKLAENMLHLLKYSSAVATDDELVCSCLAITVLAN